MIIGSALLRRAGLLAGVALILLLPSFLWGSGYSGSVKYNYIWVSQFGSEMARGHLYPRWLPDSFEGLGAPTFYFYPPLAFWVAGVFKAVGLSTLTAINLTAFVALTLSGLAMSQWLEARAAWPRLGAMLYMAAPYHLMDFYKRGALAEFVAFIWLPWIALAIHRLPQRRGIVMLALSYAGLILTHLPMAMLVTFFLIAPLAVHALWHDRKLFGPLALGGLLGIALSAFYLLGAMTLQGAISSELLWTPWYHARSWSLLTPNSLLLIDKPIPVLALGYTLLSLRTWSVWTAIAMIAAANALGLVPALWDIDPFSRAQFPWRLLCIVEFAGITALLCSQPASELHRKLSLALLGLGGGLVAFVYLQWLPQMAAMVMMPAKYGRLAREMPDAPEYLPAGFDLRLFRESDREADLSAWDRLPRGDSVVVTRPGEVTFRHAAFPIWRVTRDGHEVSQSGPIIHVEARPGVYKIERRLIWQEVVGAFASLVAALLLCATGFGRGRSPIRR